jgi:hypothetical protein
MNTFQIECLLRQIINPIHHRFLGVFPRDLANEYAKRICEEYLTPQFYVANTKPAKHPGEHWVVFYWKRCDQLEFYDSLGLTPEIYGFYVPNSVIIHMLPRPLQSPFSNVCGQYCVLFIIYRIAQVAYSPNEMVKEFTLPNMDARVKVAVDHLVEKYHHCSTKSPCTSCNYASQCCSSKNNWCDQ